MTLWEGLTVHVRPADLLDIAVIACLVYCGVRWVWHETSRTAAVFLALLLLLYAAARVFGMYMTLAVFRVGLGALLIGLVVVFQQDIRNWFGQFSIAWRFRRLAPADRQTVDPLLEAVARLAEEKTGALIVLRGRQSTDLYTRGGIRVWGEVSIPLLQSIFHPETAGHDGAVIIHGNFIESFGVHLPLSHNLAEVGVGGTRHTAALGLSECCDALVIAVSEERGTVSVAEKGRLHTLAAPADLAACVHRFVEDRFPPPNRKLFTFALVKQLGLKAAAALAACLLWFLFVYQADNVQRTFAEVPVEFRNVPPDWVVIRKEPEKLRLTLTGPERAFDALNVDSLSASVDVQKLSEGEHQVPITEGHLKLPPNLFIRSLDAEAIHFEAFRVVPVELPVKPELYGSPPAGLALGKVDVLPATVRLLVPQRKRAEILDVPTEIVFLSTLKETTVLTPELILPPNVQFAGGRAPDVRLVVHIRPDDEEKSASHQNQQ